jgi:hypothetical protein
MCKYCPYIVTVEDINNECLILPSLSMPCIWSKSSVMISMDGLNY